MNSKSIHLSIYLIIGLFSSLNTLAQNQILYDNIEITCQVYNFASGTDVVQFELLPISEKAYAWNGDCIYTEETHYCSSVYFEENYTTTGNGFNIITHGTPKEDGTMLMALNMINIRVNNNTVATVYYENRDAKYYSNCPGGFSHDITLRYDVASNTIWFYNAGLGVLPSVSIENGWEIVNNDTIYIWEKVNLPHTPLDFDGPPSAPTNLTLSGNIGDNPILNWDFNSELDMNKFDIFHSYNSTNFSYLATVNDYVNTFKDKGVIITNGRFDDLVSYKIKARDKQGLSSDYSNSASTRSNTFNKETSDERLTKTPIEDYYFSNAHPNPFNPTTKIYYNIPQDDFVTLTVYDPLGKLVTTLVKEQKSKGNYFARFDAENLSSGLYIYTIRTNNFTQSKKMILTK